MRGYVVSCVTALAMVLSAGNCVAQSPSPVVEFASLLSSVDVCPQSNRLCIDGQVPLAVAFLPPGSDVEAVLTRSPSGTPIHTHPFNVSKLYGVFSRIKAGGGTTEFVFTEPGEYNLSFQANGKVMTSLPFTVEIRRSGDARDAVEIAFIQEGPWQRWACFYEPIVKGGDVSPEFWMWERLDKIVQRGSDVYSVRLKLDEETVAESSELQVGEQQFQCLKFPLRSTADKGGRPVRMGELLSRDGLYQFVVTKNGKLHAAYALRVSAGEPKFHPRQANSYQPRSDYLVPRFAGIDSRGARAGNVYWMERLNDVDTSSVATNDSVQAVGASNRVPAAKVTSKPRMTRSEFVADAARRARAKATADVIKALDEAETQMAAGFQDAGLTEFEARVKAREQVNRLLDAQGLPQKPVIEK